MRIVTVLIALFSLVVAGCSYNSQQQKYRNGPWDGPFGTQAGITKQQIERYTNLSVIDTDEQIYRGMALPNDYGLKLYNITYVINSIEGLCAVFLESDSDEDIALLRNYFEATYGKPTIERKDKYVTWDNKNLIASPVLVINYAPDRNIVKVFYPNYDRCKLP